MTVKQYLRLAALCALPLAASAKDRPELMAFPFSESVTSGGTFAAGSTVGTNFVVSGEISSELVFSGDVPYRVTLSDATISKAVTISGNAQLWLEGESSISVSGATAITSKGSLTVSGPGGGGGAGGVPQSTGSQSQTGLSD